MRDWETSDPKVSVTSQGLAQAWEPGPDHESEGESAWGSRREWPSIADGPSGLEEGVGRSLHLGPRVDGPRGALTATRTMGPDRAVEFPHPGDVLARFRIMSELGEGAFAKVYLAEQTDLADRPVALKVAVSLGDEPQNLARLQHAHIVPIHSVHDDPATGLRLICMPYVGGANLAQVLQSTETRWWNSGRQASRNTGQSLIEALDELNRASRIAIGPVASRRKRSTIAGDNPAELWARAPVGRGAATRGLHSPSRARSLWARYFARFSWWGELEGRVEAPDEETDPARRYLRSATFVQAAVWIAARLAEALEHAHERGILHRDLKPSNILIASDGTPMLLDFNLSADTTSHDAGARAQLGGTLPYMAPEHLDAFDPEGTTPPEAVAEAADLYSLGLILFEMVAGVHPFSDPPDRPNLSDTLRFMIEERKQGAPSAREFNPMVPWGLDSVLAKCLDPNPATRYNQAAHLAEDLRRLLDDLPLKHAPERSLRERVAKWSRRHPRASSSTTIGTVACGLLLAVGFTAWTIRDHFEDSAALLHYADFTRQFRECQLLLNSVTGRDDHVARGLRHADEALGSYDVGLGDDWLKGPKAARLPANERTALREQISELVQLRARAKLRAAASAPRSVQDRLRREAVAWLNNAERFDARPSPALYLERELLHRELGETVLADRDLQRAKAHPPRTARDFDMLGTVLLAEGLKRGDPALVDRAVSSLTTATVLDPRRFWSWFTLGMCHYQQRRYEQAAGDFGTCTVLAPEFAWPYFDRGLALAATEDLAGARQSFDQALRLEPDFVQALVDRGLACLQLDDLEQAERDLGRAIALGERSVGVLTAHAEALARQGRREEAERGFNALLAARPDDPGLLAARGFSRLSREPENARVDFERALALDATNSRAHLGMAYLTRGSDPRAALESLRQALEADPAFGDALQLRAITLGRMGDRAAVADVDRLVLVPTRHRLYNAACALALLARATQERAYADRACELVARAVSAGFDRSVAATDPDLAVLRGRPEFRRLVAGHGPDF